jgi:hypothetical protein
MKSVYITRKAATGHYYIYGFGNWGLEHIATFNNYNDAWLYCMKHYSNQFLGLQS